MEAGKIGDMSSVFASKSDVTICLFFVNAYYYIYRLLNAVCIYGRI